MFGKIVHILYGVIFYGRMEQWQLSGICYFGIRDFKLYKRGDTRDSERNQIQV